MPSKLHFLLKSTIVVASIATGVFAQAQTSWPGTSSVKVIVPFSSGGASDVLTRTLSQRLQDKIGGNWVVENRTGAGGNIGMEAVKSAAPKIWEDCNAFVVAPTNPARNVKEFLDWAKQRPKGVNFGSAGVGTTPHLAGELFRVRTGIQAVHIPFRGAAQSMPALMAGDTDFAIDNIASYTPLIKSGKVRALAVTCPERWPTMPEVPTMAEAGVPDFVVTSWGAFVLPKGTPAAISTKLSQAIAELAADPALKAKYLEIGAIIKPTSPKETADFAASERVKWREVVRISGAKLD